MSANSKAYLVGGESLEAALSALRVHGRIVARGSISGYNEGRPRPGPSNPFNIITKRLTIGPDGPVV
jgi:NADPH-dependent curcumin reductase CurA